MMRYRDFVDLNIRQLEVAIDDWPQCEANRVAMREELRNLQAIAKRLSIDDEYYRTFNMGTVPDDADDILTVNDEEDGLIVNDLPYDTHVIDDTSGGVFPDAIDDKLRAEQTKKAKAQAEINDNNGKLKPKFKVKELPDNPEPSLKPEAKPIVKPELDPDRFWRATQNIAGGR